MNKLSVREIDELVEAYFDEQDNEPCPADDFMELNGNTVMIMSVQPSDMKRSELRAMRDALEDDDYDSYTTL